MVANELDIRVKDTVFDPNLPQSAPKEVHVREKEGKRIYLYKVWLYLEGEDLPFVERVTYTLHETFRNPRRTVKRTPSNPNCQLVIWTWGIFRVKATIVDKTERHYEVSHDLTYEGELPPDPDMYEYEDSDSSNRARLVSA